MKPDQFKDDFLKLFNKSLTPKFKVVLELLKEEHIFTYPEKYGSNACREVAI